MTSGNGPAVKEREVTLPITGMTCANCASTVERALKKTAGVSDATVNYATERATVHLEEEAPSVEDLIAQIERVGYGVLDVADADLEDAEAAARVEELRSQSRKFWTGVVFAGPLFVLSMARDFSLLGEWAHAPWVNWLMFALATAPVLADCASSAHARKAPSMRRFIARNWRIIRA